MSWDADLCCATCGSTLREWNYTHNTNRMIDDASPVPAHLTRETWWGGRSWWDVLDRMNGAEGARFLADIVEALEANPDRYRAMNPANGWGDYDSLVEKLRSMRDAVPEFPTRWVVSG